VIKRTFSAVPCNSRGTARNCEPTFLLFIPLFFPRDFYFFFASPLVAERIADLSPDFGARADLGQFYSETGFTVDS